MTIRLSTGLRNKMMGLEATVHAMTLAGDATIELNITGGDDTITRDAGSWITDGFVAGDVLKVDGCTTAANDTALTGTRLKTVVALTLTFDGAILDTDEAFAAGAVICAASGGSMKDVMKIGDYTEDGTSNLEYDQHLGYLTLAKSTDYSDRGTTDWESYTTGSGAPGLSDVRLSKVYRQLGARLDGPVIARMTQQLAINQPFKVWWSQYMSASYASDGDGMVTVYWGQNLSSSGAGPANASSG